MFPADVPELAMFRLPLRVWLPLKVTVLPLCVNSELLTLALPPLLVNKGMDPLLHAVPEEQTITFAWP